MSLSLWGDFQNQLDGPGAERHEQDREREARQEEARPHARLLLIDAQRSGMRRATSSAQGLKTAAAMIR
jgi:hypothetical protein